MEDPVPHPARIPDESLPRKQRLTSIEGLSMKNAYVGIDFQEMIRVILLT
jgi:hypothetical protein